MDQVLGLLCLCQLHVSPQIAADSNLVFYLQVVVGMAQSLGTSEGCLLHKSTHRLAYLVIADLEEV